jgi:hypothetical protein
MHAILGKIAKDTGGTAEANLRLRDYVRGVIEILGRTGELDGHLQGDLRDRIASDTIPHEDGDEQRREFEHEVVEEEMANA